MQYNQDINEEFLKAKDIAADYEKLQNQIGYHFKNIRYLGSSYP